MVELQLLLILCVIPCTIIALLAFLAEWLEKKEVDYFIYWFNVNESDLNDQYLKYCLDLEGKYIKSNDVYNRYIKDTFYKHWEELNVFGRLKKLIST